MRRQFLPAVLMMVIFTVLFGLAYPLVVTGIAQVAFKDKANGSLVEVDGKAAGSSLIGQNWLDDDGDPLPQYFQSRPSAAGYDPNLSLGSNLGPTNPCLVPIKSEPCLDDDGKRIDPAVVAAVKAYRELNGLDEDVPVPVDAVTSSASGLDPHISEANARLQTRRVAEERDLPVRDVRELVDDYVEDPQLGFLGEKRVNVLLLNVALDRLAEGGS